MSKTLGAQIAKYEAMKSELELDHIGKWVVMYDEEPRGFYATFADAIQDAARQFDRGPYLIRQIGASAPQLSPSLLYRPIYGDN